MSGWPQNRLYVEVFDARPDKPKTSPFTAAVKANIEKSLSPPIKNPGDRMTLRVTVDALDATQVDGRWKAQAKLTGGLADEWGARVATYGGRGNVSKTDTAGLRSGQVASEEAMNEALMQMLRMMDGKPLPVAK